MKWWRKRRSNMKRVPAEPLRWQAPARWLAIATTIFGGGWLLMNYIEHSDWERFHTLEVTGELERVDVTQIRDALQPHIESGFARIDIRAAQQAVASHSWVEDARVRRKWPGTLVVELREERPVATWFGTALMNAQGKVFIDGAAGFSGVLPDIGGPAGSQAEMIRRLEQLDGALDARGLDVRRLLKTERRAERLWLSNGIEVRLGRRDTEARLQRFLRTAWPALEQQASDIAYVDMRYTNGFAVGWKTAEKNGGQAPGDRSNVQENG